MLRELNTTAITLIPKIQCPKAPGDFRPISCCNTLYKCISSIITGRMQEIMTGIVGKEQGAFIKGRNIVHNVLLAQEILHHYGRSRISPRCVFKFDLFKAYDSVSWGFLNQLLLSFGFPFKWIMSCISTVRYSILINGELHGNFYEKKGLRQGDPMSPYLFTLVMEYLSRMLAKMAMNSEFWYHPRCKELNLTHLTYADDLLIFCKGNVKSALLIKECLEEFSVQSGLHINLAKSQAFFGGLNTQDRSELLSLLNVQEGKLPFKYLGVPLSSKKWKGADYLPLIELLTKRFKSWASRLLSYAGRIELINSVIQSIENYWASNFLIPKIVIKEVETMARRFLWSGSLEKHKAPVSWKKITSPKITGGLGIRCFEISNRASMLKLFWDLARKKDSMWVKWVHQRYIKGSNVWDVNLKNSFSWSCKAIFNLRSYATLCVSRNNLSWIAHGTPFSAKATYEHLSPDLPSCWWARILWTRLTFGRWSFITYFIPYRFF